MRDSLFYRDVNVPLTPGALGKLMAINLRNVSPRFRALPKFQLRRYTFHRCYDRRRIVEPILHPEKSNKALLSAPKNK